MQPIHPSVASLLWLPVAVASFLFPGWCLARRLRLPAPELAAFLGAAAIFFLLVLLADALHLPLHPGTLAPGLIAVGALFWRKNGTATPAEKIRPPSPWRAIPWFWLLPIVAGAAAVIGRAVVDPLSGYDNVFRWDYLARLMVARGSLAGYPPVSTADFEFYSWCDGIPPLVPCLNFWIYSVCGSFAPALTSVRVVAEFGLLAAAVWRYASLLWPNRSGAAALAVLASSSLALWSVVIGQETCITALSLVAMLYYLERHAREPRRELIVAAAIAGAVGALTREYGLAFPALGVGVLLLRRRPRDAAGLALLTVAIAGPWYLRNALLTGNPLYPQTLGGLFPGNAVHEEMMRYYRDYWGLHSSPFSAGVIPLFLLVLAGPLIALGLIGMVRARRAGALAAAGVGLVSAIWYFLNLPQSGGGWVYSARVLLPALALLAALGGWVAVASPRLQRGLAILLAIVAVDAARRCWLLPGFPLDPPVPYSFDGWRQMHDFAYDTGPYDLWRRLAREAGRGGIVVDHPAHHAILTLCQGTAVPLVSPALAGTFREPVEWEGGLAALRAAQIRFITLTPRNPITGRLLAAHRFWTELIRRYQPNRVQGFVAIYDLDRLVPATAE